MASDKQIYNIFNGKDLAEVHKLLFEEEDFLQNDEEKSHQEYFAGRNNNTDDYELEVAGEDKLREEELEVRTEDSNTEQSYSEIRSDQDTHGGNECVTCIRKKGKKIIESMEWRTTLPPQGEERRSKTFLQSYQEYFNPGTRYEYYANCS